MSRKPSSRPNARRPIRRGEQYGDLMEGADYGPLLGLLGYCLRRAQIRIYQDFLDAMEPWSITPPRFSAMVLIRHNPGMKLTELARAMGIARSGAVEVVNSLAKLGYAARRDSPEDRRAYALELTETGHEVLDAVTAKVQEHDARVSVRLDESERRQVRALLDKLG
jgi:DNA-binding MarR family transcriptional regulator